ncbi:response regulator with CheY-like receiver domain and winged-helix DNA-binding domain [Rivularia sp. PCC 7116]|uniref:response regulator n=1 Tax=Rivularia sp. PCC 7116 TaxID=373994 RepID=UPI00029F4D3C|nr:response regulator [Rivularia sp. PCC 7116]AFY56683.1 response regulator with CheY-like receiver domain and winged-helix DNA-binding domain [Rivularia sp. PCC 7116]
MNNFATFTKLPPLSLLRHLSSCFENTCLQVQSHSVNWWIYLEEGKIAYATHSIEPFDRLERHLRRLSVQVPALTSEIRVQLRMMFEPDSLRKPDKAVDNSSESISSQQPSDYQAICWLIAQRYLNPTQAAILIQELVKEVIESFLLIQKGTYEFHQNLSLSPKICRLDAEKLLLFSQERLHSWHDLNPQITSPFQRPYLWINTNTQVQKISEIQPNLVNWMKGFSLRHLAVIMNQDELVLARSLYPHIQSGAILLHEPDPPFDKLPKTDTLLFGPPVKVKQDKKEEITDSKETKVETKPETNTKQKQNVAVTKQQIPVNKVTIKQETKPSSIEKADKQAQVDNIKPIPPGTTVSPQKVYKIVSVDDSPVMLKEISRFLEDESFSVVTIDNPLKAVMSIIRHQPDLILLDLNMEGIDGYELCRIIRNNSKFKNTPIIMVTGSKGFVDKVKARLMGASGYLTKPFTRADLLKIVFMHLT